MVLEVQVGAAATLAVHLAVRAVGWVDLGWVATAVDVAANIRTGQLFHSKLHCILESAAACS